MITTEALEEENDPEVLTMTTEASIKEAEDTTRLIERIQRVNVYDNRGAGVFRGSPRSPQ